MELPSELSGELFVRVIESPDGGAIGRRVALRERVTVGRQAAEGVDLVVGDPTISRRHATFARSEGDGGACATLSDEGSHNGTFVDGARGTTWRLEPDAIVRVGDTLLTVERTDIADDEDDPGLIGRSPPMRRLRAALRELAPSALSVLVLGETGTGKEVVARKLHDESGRAGPLIAVNAAAIPAHLVESYLFGHEKGAFTGAHREQDGVFQVAEGGTLFFDEIAELPRELQPKLLRVLESLEYTRVGSHETRRADVRVLAATNADLAREVGAGSFRADLYARLAGAVLRVPPLRARRGDIPQLARHFFASGDPPRVPAWTASFIESLVLHPWPMNVRELRGAVARLVRMDEPLLHARHLRAVLGEVDPPSQRDAGEPPSREELEALLRAHGGNVSRIARASGRHAKQLYRWFERHGLDPAAYR